MLIFFSLLIVCKPSDVPSPVDGTSILSTDGYTVSYSCDKGFTLKGNAVRVCQDDNTGWNGTAPACGKHSVGHKVTQFDFFLHANNKGTD